MVMERSADVLSLVGKYRNETNENLEAYLKEAGVAEENAKKVLAPGNMFEVIQEGTEYTVANSYGGTTKFVLEQEFDESMVKGLKSLAIRKGNTVTVTSRLPDGRTGIRTYAFSDKDVKAVMTFNGVSCKRYYKRV